MPILFCWVGRVLVTKDCRLTTHWWTFCLFVFVIVEREEEAVALLEMY